MSVIRFKIGLTVASIETVKAHSGKCQRKVITRTPLYGYWEVNAWQPSVNTNLPLITRKMSNLIKVLVG